MFYIFFFCKIQISPQHNDEFANPSPIVLSQKLEEMIKLMIYQNLFKNFIVIIFVEKNLF
jgi:hypothetical protein